MTPIKFGTDGWRAIIADDYTVENVRRVSAATARWMQQKGQRKVVIGHDTRYGGELFAETAARVMGHFGMHVHLAKGFVSTPMVSLGVVKTGSYLGVVITASHNPPSYNGFKLKSHFGGATVPADIAEVEALVPERFDEKLPTLEEMSAKGLLEYVDLETIYAQEAASKFDLDAIRNSGLRIAYDAMYGAGQRIVQRLLPEALFLHCDENPGFHGQAPEPIHRNLGLLSKTIAESGGGIAVGLANDGDADRIGMYDDRGNFVDSHHLLLLLLHYLHRYKGLSGKVIITFSVTDKMKKMCAHYGLPFQVTKIGFKYITEIMEHEDVLIGGEESGGLAVKGHVPERDGVWMGLLIFEFMAKTGKSLRELIQEVYEIVGPFATDRYDLHLPNEQKEAIIAQCRAGGFQSFGPLKVVRTEDIDGFKFYFSDDEWVMIRPSGTEPLLRVYSQAPVMSRVHEILDITKAALLQ
jgi:phosphomannomutase